MGRMYPDRLNAYTQSRAERMLYTAFAQQLDDSDVVFHQVGWLAHDRRKHPQDGEADFVIAHPDRGCWSSRSREGRFGRMGSPAAGRRAPAALRRSLPTR